MPGSDDQYDQVHTYSQDHAGKSKTTKPAVREIGRDGAPLRLLVGQQRDEPRTPPSGVLYFYTDDATNWKLKRPDGTVETIPSAGGTLTDSGSDNPDGGDIYELPAAEDSISMQGSGEVTDAEALGPTARFVGEDRDPANVGTPASGEVFLFFDTNQNPKVKDSTGTVSSPVDGQDISPASVGTDSQNTEKYVSPDGFSSVQAAHDALPSDGGVIHVTDDVAETGITITKEVRIRGATSGGRFIQSGSAGGAVIDASGGDGVIVQEQACVFENLHIKGDKTAGTIGMDFRTGASNITMRNVGIEQFETGLKGVDMFDSTLHLYSINNSQDGVLWADSAAEDFNNAIDATIYTVANGRDGIRVDNDEGGQFIGNRIWLLSEDNGGWGYQHISGTHSGISIQGYGTEGNSSGSMKVASDHSDTVVEARLREGRPTVNGGKIRVYEGESGQSHYKIENAGQAVSTSTETILADLKQGALATVYGQLSGDFAPAFTDLLLWAREGSVVVVASAERGTPASRTYSVNFADLQLAMGSDTYDISYEVTEILGP